MFFQILTIYLPAFLVALTVLVFIHELGHYSVARLTGVRVEVFSIGFGRELFGWTDSHGTRWKFSIVPLGGYVKMFGDVNAASAGSLNVEALSPADRETCFHAKTVGQRAAIVFAGPFANYLLALVILAGLFVFIGQRITPPVASGIVSGSAAEVAGLKTGDRFLTIDGQTIDRFEEVRQIVMLRPEVPLTMEIARDGQVMNLTVTPKRDRFQDRFGDWHERGLLGVEGQGGEFVQYDPVTALWRAVLETQTLTESTFLSVAQMIRGTRSVQELGGPIRIAKVSGQMLQIGIPEFIWVIGVLSLSLCLINLVPIPMLDGGHLLFYAVEAVRGRPVGERAQEYGFKIGLALVLTFFAFVTWNDLFVDLRVADFIKGLVS